MKLLKILTLAVILSSASSFAGEIPAQSYVAAFPHSEKSATPGTFGFSREGDKMYLSINVVAFDIDVKMPVVIRESKFKDSAEKVFDAIYVADDGLLSITVTGRLSEKLWGRSYGLS